ncbi:UNKNOWN [Stylonychia lemnae]|uniref:Uncharacterized protein n=1 Tax=Stylonychia lemnae TaxID=5949 RepID=A0A077ZXV5_STYLE|nr:UNKNOWN [Stylonychia lemnae]|eukprot:CDW74741.1 UNKNOWN [Stylonychia lemnae]
MNYSHIYPYYQNPSSNQCSGQCQRQQFIPLPQQLKLVHTVPNPVLRFRNIVCGVFITKDTNAIQSFTNQSPLDLNDSQQPVIKKKRQRQNTKHFVSYKRSLVLKSNSSRDLSGRQLSQLSQQFEDFPQLQSYQDYQCKKEQIFSIHKSNSTSTLKKQRIEKASLKQKNLNKPHQYFDEERTLRSDVIFKAIIRDMRKFFKNQFNQLTKYKKKFQKFSTSKNTNIMLYQTKEQLFYKSLRLFLNQLIHNGKNDNLDQMPLEMEKVIIDLVFFFGSFIYEKEMDRTISYLKQYYLQQHQQTSTPDLMALGIKFEEFTQQQYIHQIQYHLYSFSLGKLENLMNQFQFSFFFVQYYQLALVQNNIVGQKPTMAKNQCYYVEAYNLLLRGCQQTLKKFQINNQYNKYDTQFHMKLNQLLDIKEVPISNSEQKSTELVQMNFGPESEVEEESVSDPNSTTIGKLLSLRTGVSVCQ